MTQPDQILIKNNATNDYDSRYPNGGKPTPMNRTVTMTGSGFGAAPNIVLHRTFNVGSGLVPLAPPAGEIGTLDTSQMSYATVYGKGCANGFAGDGSIGKIAVFTIPRPTQRYVAAISLAVPSGKIFPGLDNTPGVFPSASSAKPMWIMNNPTSTGDKPDFCMPTHTGSNGHFESQGNSLFGQEFWPSANVSSFWNDSGWNRFTYIHDCDSADPLNTLKTQRQWFTSGKTGTAKTDGTVFYSVSQPGFYDKHNGGLSIAAADCFLNIVKLNSYAQLHNSPDQALTQLSFRAWHMRVESASNANDYVQCAYLLNANSFAAATDIIEIPSTSWSDTSVSISPSSHDRATYTHWGILFPDGVTTQVQALT